MHLTCCQHTTSACRRINAARLQTLQDTTGGLHSSPGFEATVMLLVLRALLVLSLAPLLHGARKSQSASAKLGPRAGLKGNSVRLVIDPSVLPHFTAKSPSSIANMSLSPWTYIDSSLDSRLPKRISNAQCLTTGCLSPQGGGEDRALEAKPIKYEVLVLHRVLKASKKKGRKARKQYIFTLGTEVITAGCTCVRPTVIPQG